MEWPPCARFHVVLKKTQADHPFQDHAVETRPDADMSGFARGIPEQAQRLPRQLGKAALLALWLGEGEQFLCEQETCCGEVPLNITVHGERFCKAENQVC